jgi:hypothetical protein
MVVVRNFSIRLVPGVARFADDRTNGAHGIHARVLRTSSGCRSQAIDLTTTENAVNLGNGP